MRTEAHSGFFVFVLVVIVVVVVVVVIVVIVVIVVVLGLEEQAVLHEHGVDRVLVAEVDFMGNGVLRVVVGQVGIVEVRGVALDVDHRADCLLAVKAEEVLLALTSVPTRAFPRTVVVKFPWLP
jgi:hypothetical protein